MAGFGRPATADKLRRHAIAGAASLNAFKQGKMADAAEPYERVVQDDPRAAVASNNLAGQLAGRFDHAGLAYLQTGDKAQARQNFERALKIRADFEGAEEARRLLSTLN